MFLKIWLDYYSRYFDSLHVFTGTYNANPPDQFAELHQKYNFELINLPLEVYSEDMHKVVFGKQRELLLNNEWVLYSDADEIIVADPRKYDGLRHFVDVSREAQTFCEGYDVYQGDDENPILYDQPILQQRKWWCKDATKSYNKPALSRVPTDWELGFHSIRGTSAGEMSEIKDTGLYLMHLKFMDLAAKVDYPRHTTGTHCGMELFKENGQLIPEKIRRIF